MKSKIKEIAAISFFTLLAAIASIFLADIIVYPLTGFAVKNVDIYNLIFENLLFILIIAFLIYSFIKKYKTLSEDGMNLKTILLYFTRRPLHYGGLFLSFIMISIILIAVLYILFSLNYYYLYKISGGV